jgi:Family of unknown function (DUF6941)
VPRVDCFLLADAAQVVDGKLYVLGGGWERLTVQQVPVTRSFEIATRIIVAWTETNRPLTFSLQLATEDGEVLLDPAATPTVTVGRPVHLREGSDQAVPLVLKIAGVSLKQAGRYAFTLGYDGEEVARTAFEVVIGKRR